MSTLFSLWKQDAHRWISYIRRRIKSGYNRAFLRCWRRMLHRTFSTSIFYLLITIVWRSLAKWEFFSDVEICRFISRVLYPVISRNYAKMCSSLDVRVNAIYHIPRPGLPFRAYLPRVSSVSLLNFHSSRLPNDITVHACEM